jgi:hypothetical protein
MNSLIQFKFKGERTYVHGSDFYNKVSALLGLDEYVNDISFRQVTNKNCFLKSAAEDNDTVAGIVITNQQQYVLVESTTTVSGSYLFDEEFLVNEANIEKNIIKMDMQRTHTVIENIIAMTKKLNYSVNPEVNGKWLFGQLKLNIPFPSEVRAISIESTRRIPNRFSENAITIDGKQYGTIIFIVGKP